MRLSWHKKSKSGLWMISTANPPPKPYISASMEPNMRLIFRTTMRSSSATASRSMSTQHGAGGIRSADANGRRSLRAGHRQLGKGTRRSVTGPRARESRCPTGTHRAGHRRPLRCTRHKVTAIQCTAPPASRNTLTPPAAATTRGARTVPAGPIPQSGRGDSPADATLSATGRPVRSGRGKDRPSRLR